MSGLETRVNWRCLISGVAISRDGLRGGRMSDECSVVTFEDVHRGYIRMFFHSMNRLAVSMTIWGKVVDQPQPGVMSCSIP